MGPPGHFGIGLAAKPAAPREGTTLDLVVAKVPDLLCFAFQAAGIENVGASTTDISRGVEISSPASVPWSHGLFMCAVWSVVAAAIVFLYSRDRRTSVVTGLLVFSHWVLDFIVHVPDLPLLFEGSPLVGLGLWGSGPGLVISGILEVGLFAGGLAIYLASRKRASVRRVNSGGVR